MDCFKKKLSKTKITPKREPFKCLICYTSKKIQEFRCDNCFTDTGEKSWYICRDCNIDLTEKGMNCPVCRGIEKIDNEVIDHYSKSEKCMFHLHTKMSEFKNKFKNKFKNENIENEKKSCNFDCNFDFYTCTGILKILFIIFSFTLISFTICMKNMTIDDICYICYINSLVFLIYCICCLYLFFQKLNDFLVLILSLIGTLSIITSFATVGEHNSCRIDGSTYLIIFFLLPAIFKINMGFNNI